MGHDNESRGWSIVSCCDALFTAVAGSAPALRENSLRTIDNNSIISFHPRSRIWFLLAKHSRDAYHSKVPLAMKFNIRTYDVTTFLPSVLATTVVCRRGKAQSNE
jgi:hypothetical protein